MNLKTSSLRLFPLNVITEDESSSATTPPVSSHDAPHCLEFTYDCDAPKVKISVDVYSRKRADGKSSKASVYSQMFEGGFDRSLKMEDGATLELSHIVTSLKLDVPHEASTSEGKDANEPVDGDLRIPPSDAAAVTSSAITTKRRLSTLPFRRRNRTDMVGPALRVVDVDAVTETPVATIATPKKQHEVQIRVSLTLEALDIDGNPLASPNSQSTRLVIVRAGQPAKEESEEDTRHWTVQVVRRDATVSFEVLFGEGAATFVRL